MTSRLPVYRRTSPALYLSIDVGTVYSSVTYCLCEPSRPLEINTVEWRVTNTLLNGTARIPSIIYYRADGQVAVAGVDAASDDTKINAQMHKWAKAEWFNLHLNLESLSDIHIPPLPLNKSAIEVLADFLRYLHGMTLRYIKSKGTSYQSFLNGSYTKYLILGHTSKWQRRQHDAMRDVAWLSGIVPQSHTERVLFINEGTASFHFAVYKQFDTPSFKNSNGIAVVDAGGATINISAYKNAGSVLIEVARPECHFQGSVLVTQDVKEYLSTTIGKGADPVSLNIIVDFLNRKIMSSFSREDALKPVYDMNISGLRNNGNNRNGLLSIPTEKIVSSFEPTVHCIEESLKEIARRHGITAVCFFGGFAKNPWLYETVSGRLRLHGISSIRPSQAQAAVAEGGIIQTMKLS
ncbi:hypothetical protein AX16_005058 [Volvariella volvacea WC 439]|nr:hypothetical protein AX16_005058 [Volvariella volvacea WC 439]